MKLVVGLGNPGIEYQRTRHNVGFDCIDRLARRVSDGASPARARFQGLAVDGEWAGEKVLLLKPMTYMNLSGSSVAEAIRFYKLDPTRDLLAVVDDIALPCGSIRIRGEGSAGGHNGLADIELKLGTHRYPRCRIGIDPPGRIPQRDYVLGRFREDQQPLVDYVLGRFREDQQPLVDYVLGRFREDQQPLVDEALALSVDAALCWIERGTTEAMNRFNRRGDDGKGPKKEKPAKPAPPPTARAEGTATPEVG